MKPDTVKYVVGFLFCGEEVLLIRKARPQWQRGKLNGVGGHVEMGETFRAAMIREFLEETRVRGLIWEQFVQYSGVEDPGKVGATGGVGTPFEIAFFRSEVKTKPAVSPTPDEPLEWWPISAIRQLNTLPNVQWLVPMAFYARRVDWPFSIQEPLR